MSLDYIVFGLYAVVIIGFGLYFSRSKKGKEKTAEDYFLASKSLPWWAIGSSLIAANISAEQFIGMSGSGFAVGLAIASYEWMAAITLLAVAKYFLPIFIKQGLYTIPEFIERRFNTSLKTILAIFWIALFIFVNLTSVLYLGGKALDAIFGNNDGSMIVPFMIGLALFSVAYSIFGGLSSVAWTDVIQVVFLVIGGIITTVIALDKVTPDGGVFHGLSYIYQNAGDKFHMIISKSNPEYKNLPGIAMLIGGLWVANLYYWGFNQYIIQRALAAKSLPEAQRGLAFAGFLKLLIPFIVVIPGITAYVMYTHNIAGAHDAFQSAAGGINYDKTYPWLINTFIPVGLKGLVAAALSAAIVSSLASMLNSTSTIFTMDIYKTYINKKATDRQLVRVGRLAILAALVISLSLAHHLGSIPQMFQYIQEYTGLVSPGILAVFMMGLFWRKTSVKGAIVGVVSSIPVALLLKFLKIQMPFIDQMLYTCLISIVVILCVSLTSDDKDDKKQIPLDKATFMTDNVFNIAAYGILILTAVLYVVFW